MFREVIIGSILLSLVACGSKRSSSPAAEEAGNVANVPEFMADSAYLKIQRQCEFGPRTMGSEAHEKCGQYIVREFERQGCVTTLQKATFTRYDGRKYDGYNIIAQTNPAARQRIMICTHWDSRPWCDADPDSSKWHQPVLAADDGASGVGVMIELARILHDSALAYGVDFVCFDAEDMGTPSWEEKEGDDSDTWCLGAQYWARHPHSTAITYAVLLDMVGGQGASFYQEGFSLRYAPAIVEKIWNKASQAGYRDFFPTDRGGFITDDHLPMNTIAKIPTIDIIPYYPMTENVFGPVWHTTRDTMDNISTLTLKAVGQTLVQLLYTEQYEDNK